MTLPKIYLALRSTFPQKFGSERVKSLFYSLLRWQSHLCNFDEGIRRNICEIILNSGIAKCFRCRSSSSKDLSIFSSGGHLVQLSRIICAILVEGIMGNICIHLFQRNSLLTMHTAECQMVWTDIPDLVPNGSQRLSAANKSRY